MPTKQATPPGHKRIQCIVRVDQYDRLRREAFKAETSITELVRQGVDLRLPPTTRKQK